MEAAKNSRVNKHNPDNIPPYFDTLMKPVLRGKLWIQKNTFEKMISVIPE